MTIKNIRRDNARALAESVGGPSKFAKKIGKSLSQVSQCIGHTKGGDDGLRGIGSKLAREIEAVFGFPVGWLDVAHKPGAAVKAASDAEESDLFQEQIEQILTLFAALPAGRRDAVKGAIVALWRSMRDEAAPIANNISHIRGKPNK